MSDNILTNYNKFDEKQVDYEYINKEKLYYNIYNNKINQPLQKFWFKCDKVKFSNQYNDYKTIKMLINNKNNESIKLITFIKNLSEFIRQKLSSVFENITLDLPWKEYDNYPYLFNFYTNKNTIFVDENKNIIEYSQLDFNDSYTVLFEIQNLRIIKINLDYSGKESTYNIKINLAILMIQKENKKDLKNFLLDVISNDSKLVQDKEEIKINHIIPKKQLPFLTDISSTILKKNNDIVRDVERSNSVKLVIDNNQLLNAMKSLKKVNFNKKVEVSDDEQTEIKDIYINQKNSLKKVSTKEKSLINHIKKKKKSKNKRKELELEK